MDVNNLWAAFMLINTCYLTSFLRGVYLASEDQLGLPVRSVLGWSLQQLGVYSPSGEHLVICKAISARNG